MSTVKSNFFQLTPIPLLAAFLEKPEHFGLCLGLSAHTIHVLDLGHFGNG